MDIRFDRVVACVAVMAAAGLATGCAGRDARDFRGRWVPVNQYAASTEAIPLHSAQVYQASPMDGTLRNLLARWARDSGSELDYRHPSDFVLHRPVADVRAQTLSEALVQLHTAFGGHGVLIRLDGNRLLVTTGSDRGG